MRRVNIAGPDRGRRLLTFRDLAVIVFGIAVTIAPTSVHAGAQVSGTLEAVSIEARDTSVQEILAALGNTFDVHYHSSVSLGKRLTRLIEGHFRE
jgi:hypothetical protein